MATRISDLADTLVRGCVSIGSATIAVRAVSYGENRRVLKLLGPPVAPKKANTLGEQVPDESDPDYLHALNAWESKLSLAEAAIAIENQTAAGAFYAPDMTDEAMLAWLTDSIKEVDCLAYMDVATILAKSRQLARGTAPEQLTEEEGEGALGKS